MNFRQGDTTTVAMVASAALAEGMKLKVGIYTIKGLPLYKTTYPGGDIDMVDSTHFVLQIDYEITRKMVGTTTLRAAIYSADRRLVNSAENHIVLNWAPEPVTRELE